MNAPVMETPALWTSRAEEYLRYSRDELAIVVDRMFAWLLAAEWIGMIVTALVLSCALAACAQAQQAPKEHSMTGCLQKGTEANTYMVTDVEGSGPKSIGIVSDETSSLAASPGIFWPRLLTFT